MSEQQTSSAEITDPSVAEFRRSLREIGTLLSVSAPPATGVLWVDEALTKVSNSQDRLTSRRTPGGSIDSIVDEALKQLGYGAVSAIPELLSAVGVLVNARVVLGLLQVRNDYGWRPRAEDAGLDYALLAGYRPHRDIIRNLPRCYFEHPRYVAPIEDLLDWAALDHYAGKRAGEAEDGAIGWLVDWFLHPSRGGQIGYGPLADATAHWTEERLEECRDTWLEVVKPVLVERRESMTRKGLRLE